MRMISLPPDRMMADDRCYLGSDDVVTGLDLASGERRPRAEGAFRGDENALGGGPRPPPNGNFRSYAVRLPVRRTAACGSAEGRSRPPGPCPGATGRPEPAPAR